MTDILAKICADKYQHIARQKQHVSELQLQEAVLSLPPTRGFRAALQQQADEQQTALITEIKKASPSRGVIRANFDPVSIARDYKQAGATCLSVLTDAPYFQGSDDYVRQVHAAVTLPILRKDFMLDPYQILESRALGADCILLIMAALSDMDAAELEQQALMLGMDVLIEVHNEEELSRALRLHSPLIGINNRDLKTLEVSLSVTEQLCPHIPAGYITVCESGIYSRDEITRMHTHGVYAFLVGESLMRQDNIVDAVHKLLH